MDPKIVSKALPPGRLGKNPWFIAARITLMGALFAAPLTFGAVEPWAWSALAALASLSLMLWGAGCVSDGQARVHGTVLYLPPLVLVATAILQWTSGASLDPIATREAAIKGGAYVIIFFLVATFLDTAPEKLWHGLGFGAAVYSFAMAAFAIIQLFVSPGRIYGRVTPTTGAYVFGSYVNHNHYAGLMELLLPLAAAFCLTRPSGSDQRWLAGVGCGVGLLSVILSGSRAGVVAVGVEGMVLAAIVIAKANADRFRLLAAVSVSCALLAAASIWLMPEAVTRRFGDIVRVNDSWETRKHLTADSFRMLAHHPVLGVGLGAFETAYPRYQSFASNLRIDYAHNDVVQLLAETGCVGTICLIVLLASSIALLGALSRRLAIHQQWYGIAAAVGLLGVAMHSCFDFNLHIPANTAWFAVVAGVASAAASG